RNSQPQFIQDGDETFRAPSVEFLQLSDPIPSDFSRRAALGLEVNASLGTTEPVYVFNLNNALNGDPLHDNPATPTAITGAFFTDIDIANAGTTRTAEVFFDTGAQVTVVNELLAAQLGFDVVNDEPDFTVPIIGVGGAQADIPGFVADSLTIPAVGGSFTATEVPIVVLENVPNPLGAGILDGILGTNVFWDRDLVVDPTGDRLWISDPVTDFKPTVGQSFALVNWSDGAIWDGGTVPGETDVVAVRRGVEFDVNTARVFRLAVEAGGELFVRRFGNGGADLSVYTDASIEAGATLHVSGDGVFSATSIEVQDGGNVRSAGFGRLEGDVTLNGQLNPTEGNFEIGGSLTVGTTGEITIAPSFALSQFGQRSPIAVESVLTLDGTLTLRPSFGFREVGDSGELITAESVLGRFETIDYGDAIDGESWAVTYTETAVVVTWALFGDANLDQQVEQGDLNAVLNNWGLAGQAWATGDFNGDGFIDQTDLNAVLNNWGSSVAPSFEGFAVPESAVGLAVLGVLGLVRRGARWGRVA
ncbi:MAG: aspartyl protease family protein, partial [Planctomycetota bacterium]